MKKLLGIALLAASLALSACTTVPAGHVGVLVHLLGSSSGVDSEEKGPGRYFLTVNEQMYLFPTFTQNYTWTKSPHENKGVDESISFQTVEGLSVNADIGISYHIDPTKVHSVFQKYRRGVEEITDTFLRNMVRDALVEQASDQSVEYVYGAGKAQLINGVELKIRDQVQDIGIVVEKVYWIGDLRLPDTVTQAINAKIQATQMAQQRQNEIAQARAEADKQIEVARGEAGSQLTKAKAEAEALQLRGDALRKNPEVLQLNAIERWNGVLPTMVGGTGAVPFIDVTKK